MKSMIFIVLALQNALAYHDPDLNYHLSQVQKVSNCDNGYSYAAPAVQLTTTGIKAPAATYLPQPVVSSPSYQYSGGSGYSSGGSSGYSSGGSSAYSTGITYQSAAPQVTYAAPQVTYAAPQVTYAAPQVAYAAQPATTYQTSSLASNYNNYAAQGYTKEYHGYATSAGLSAAASGGKTVTPLATYAQAPIISKVTAAPLIAKFSLSPAKTSYVTQNLVAQQVYSAGSAAKASLNSYSNIQAGGPVVSQVYAAPSTGYATSPALRVQQSQIVGQAHYAAPAVAQYAQYSQVPVAAPVAHFSPAVAQYSTSSVSHASAPSSSYFTPDVSQHSGGAISQYTQHSGAAISQYSAPVATQHTAHYSSPVVAQYSAPAVVQHSAPTVVQHSTPVVAQYSAPAVAHYSAPAVASVSQYASTPVGVAHVPAPAYAAVAAPAVAKVAAPLAVKNVHTEFLENYDAHPRYAFEYSVNDPHTGDIKQQKEERDGEVVKGQYSLVEPDGSVRTVNYVADWETGFHADVRNSKDNQH